MRTVLAVLFGLLAGAIIGLVGGAIIGLIVLLLITYPGQLSYTDQVGLSFGWLAMGLLGLPLGAVIGAGVGAIRSWLWYRRVLAGGGLGLVLGLASALYLGVGLLEISLTFTLVGIILGLVQSSVTLLVDKLTKIAD